MYRKYIIKDEEGKELSFRVFPDIAGRENLVVPDKDEIEMVLTTREALTDLIRVAHKFMDGNTINRLEIVEMEEE